MSKNLNITLIQLIYLLTLSYSSINFFCKGFLCLISIFIYYLTVSSLLRKYWWIGLVTRSSNTPVGSNSRKDLIAATYAVKISGVLTPGCNNLVSKAFWSFLINTGLKSVFGKQLCKSSTAGSESGYSKMKNVKHLRTLKVYIISPIIMLNNWLILVNVYVS